MNATFDAADKTMQSLIMGCYGLGLTRILAASLEALSLPTELRWPLAIAPYKVCIITPKVDEKMIDSNYIQLKTVYGLISDLSFLILPQHGSKEESAAVLTQGLYDLMECQNSFKNDIIVDDRTNLSIGRRLQEAKRVGYPLIIVIGRRAIEDIPRFEVYDLINNKEYEWTDGSLATRLKEYCAQVCV